MSASSVAGTVGLVAAVLLALKVELQLVATARRKPGGKHVGAGHVAPFVAGLAVLVFALAPPLESLTQRLLSAHMLQHVLLADVAPALLILGLRWTTPRGAVGRVWQVVQKPQVALPAWMAAQWVWALPPVFDQATTHPALHAVEHATLFYTGVVLWWIVIEPVARHRASSGARRLTYLGITRFASAVVCVPLTWLGHTVYPHYAAVASRPLGLTAISDQQLAGASMCFLEFLVFGVAFAVVFVDMLSREDKLDALRERARSG
jgi:putative membrane protein